MPTLPWTPVEEPAPDDVVVVLGSKLELRSYRHILGFLRAALSVRRQVRYSPGALGVSLIAQPLRKTFWTLSAWSDGTQLDAFVGNLPHADVMRRFHDRLQEASFTTWNHRASALPTPNSNAKELWREAKDRLAASTNGGHR
jgi:hypothetical protein